MIEYKAYIICDRCKSNISMPILPSDLQTCVVQPAIVRGVFNKSKWVETADGKHICPDCTPDLRDMNKGIGKLKNKFWKGGN